MKRFTAALLCALASFPTVSAQDLTTLAAEIPACALPGYNQAVVAAGCGLTDYACQCGEKRQAINTQASPTVVEACSDNITQLQEVVGALDALCAAAADSPPIIGTDITTTPSPSPSPSQSQSPTPSSSPSPPPSPSPSPSPIVTTPISPIPGTISTSSPTPLVTSTSEVFPVIRSSEAIPPVTTSDLSSVTEPNDPAPVPTTFDSVTTLIITSGLLTSTRRPTTRRPTSTQSSDETSPSDTSPETDPDTQPVTKGGLSTGAKAGIGAGVGGSAFVLTLIAFIFCRRRHRGSSGSAPLHIFDPARNTSHDKAEKAELAGSVADRRSTFGVMRKSELPVGGADKDERTSVGVAEMEHREHIDDVSKMDGYRDRAVGRFELGSSASMAGIQSHELAASTYISQLEDISIPGPVPSASELYAMPQSMVVAAGEGTDLEYQACRLQERRVMIAEEQEKIAREEEALRRRKALMAGRA